MNGNAINKTVLTCCGTSDCLQPSFLVYLFLLFWLSYPLKIEGLWADIGLNCLFQHVLKIAERVVKR